MTVAGTGGLTSTQIVADTGNIGTLTADHFSAVLVNAQLGSIGGITAHSATAAAISGTTLTAGTTIGPISAWSDFAGFAGDYGFILRCGDGLHGRDHCDSHRRNGPDRHPQFYVQDGWRLCRGHYGYGGERLVELLPMMPSPVRSSAPWDRSWAGSMFRKAISRHLYIPSGL